MSKSKKVFFAINLATFLMFIALPTLLIEANDKVDVSIIFSVAEEENKENHKEINNQADMQSLTHLSILFLLAEAKISVMSLENYLTPPLSKDSPPPKL